MSLIKKKDKFQHSAMQNLHVNGTKNKIEQRKIKKMKFVVQIRW